MKINLTIDQKKVPGLKMLRGKAITCSARSILFKSILESAKETRDKLGLKDEDEIDVEFLNSMAKLIKEKTGRECTVCPDTWRVPMLVFGKIGKKGIPSMTKTEKGKASYRNTDPKIPYYGIPLGSVKDTIGIINLDAIECYEKKDKALFDAETYQADLLYSDEYCIIETNLTETDLNMPAEREEKMARYLFNKAKHLGLPYLESTKGMRMSDYDSIPKYAKEECDFIRTRSRVPYVAKDHGE